MLFRSFIYASARLSYNTWDSLAEAYMKHGDKELAIQNYRKSLELNSENTNAIEKLKQLSAP